MKIIITLYLPSWGHATSTDLIHWKHLPVALYEEDGIMIYSGSAVQLNNTNTMALIYTGMNTIKNRQTQNIAFSPNGGISFHKYVNNPVLDLNLQNFRDPKVLWYKSGEGKGYWVMIVAVPYDHKVQFYKSDDLINWTFMSEFGNSGTLDGIWECPDVSRFTQIIINYNDSYLKHPWLKEKKPDGFC